MAMSRPWCAPSAKLRRTLKPAGTFFLNLGDTYYSAKGRPHGRDDKHNGRQMMRRHCAPWNGPGVGAAEGNLSSAYPGVSLSPFRTMAGPCAAQSSGSAPASLPEPTAHDRPWRTFEHVFLFSKSPAVLVSQSGARRRGRRPGRSSPVPRMKARTSPPYPHRARTALPGLRLPDRAASSSIRSSARGPP